ncbi:MAG: hypothetical protein MJ176_06285 [Treponema sp.]|nr:hypothetical protein [Treponema sp.]
MTKKSIFIYIAASIAILVPVPGRFVYGLTMIMELILLMTVGTSVQFLIKKTGYEKINTVATLFTLLCVTILYRNIIAALQSEIALTLGFCFYLPAFSSFMIGFMFSENDLPPVKKLLANLITTFKFSLFALFFFLVRDVFGFGTFTFFGKNHNIFEHVVLGEDRTTPFSFLASLPGGLFLAAIILFGFILVRKRFYIIHRFTANSKKGGTEK